jgi:pyruvate ferredoxin oxidoreductase beta subunit
MTNMSLKDLSELPTRITSGHRLCAGCAEGIIARQILMGTDKPLVVANSTGCFEVSTTIFPYTAWNTSWIHTAFANGAATGAGVETAYRALKKKGKVKEDFRFVTFAGDGATYDIGFQALSGALERGHQMMFVCFNNEAYMNTGIQRSSATEFGASTTTTPAGTVMPGKMEYPKDFTMIIAAHNIPYAAQVSPHNWRDLISKSQKGFECGGPAFINAISPCPRGWRCDTSDTIAIAKLAVETCVWPLFECVNGKFTLTADSSRIAEGKQDKRPVTDWINSQGRFKHLTKENLEPIVEQIQGEVDRRWNKLLKLCEM